MKTKPAPSTATRLGLFLFPMKKTYYFPHDYTASNDVKCLFLRQALGMEGYGIFWFLVENLANSEGRLPMEIIPVLSMQMHVNEDKVHSVITKFNLFKVTDDNFFYSERLNDHLEIRKNLSESGKKGSKARWDNRDANGEAITLPNNEANAKESKGKEIKENEINEIESKQNTFALFGVEDIFIELDKEKPLKRPYFKRMAEIHNLNDKQVKEAFKKWAVIKEGEAMTINKAENSFNLFLQNNFKSYIQKEEKPKGKNIFDEIYQDLKNEEELNKPKP